MHIPDPDSHALQIFCQVLRHAFGQGGDQGAESFLRRHPHFGKNIVYLSFNGANCHLRVHQPCGPQDLFGHLAGPLHLPLARGGGNAEHLGDPGKELIKGQGPVVKGRGQAEAVFHQFRFSGQISTVHGPDLGDGHMAFIHNKQKVFGKIVDEGIGGLPGLSAVKITGIVLYAVTVADLQHHLHVVGHPLLDALGFQRLLVVQKHLLLPVHIRLYVPHGAFELFRPGGIMGGGEDGRMVADGQQFAGKGVDLGNPVDLIPEEADPVGAVFGAHGENIQNISPDPEGAPLKVHVVSLELNLHQPAHDLVALYLHARPQGDGELQVLRRISQCIDAGNGGNDDHIPPLVQGAGGGMPQPVDLFVDGGGLFYIGVGRGNVGFGLVVIVIRDEILHRTVRKKGPQLAAKLGGQGLVVGQHQRGLLHLLNDLGHGIGLAAAGNTQQHLELVTRQHAPRQLFYGLGLVSLRGEGGYYMKAHTQQL